MIDTKDAGLLAQIRKVREDPWEFLKGIRTLDQSDKANPIKPFPVHRDYLKLYTRLFQKERLILVPKSRRMTISWTTIALITHDTIFNVGRLWAFVSKKEDDSDELLKRVDFILKNLDHSIIPKEVIPRYEATYCKMRFSELSSEIRGYPSGSDQLRQFTFSGIFGDESAFWDDAEEMFGASKPTIEAKGGGIGGKFILVSSAAPGFFQRLVHDTSDEDKGQMEASIEDLPPPAADFGRGRSG